MVAAVGETGVCEGLDPTAAHREELAMKHPTDKLLTLLGQNAGLHALTGQDRADMIAYGRAVWAEASLQTNVLVTGARAE